MKKRSSDLHRRMHEIITQHRYLYQKMTSKIQKRKEERGRNINENLIVEKQYMSLIPIEKALTAP